MLFLLLLLLLLVKVYFSHNVIKLNCAYFSINTRDKENRAAMMFFHSKKNNLGLKN